MDAGERSLSPSLRLPIREVTLLPIQPIDGAAVEQITAALRSRGVRVQLRPCVLRPPGSYQARRRQLKADVLLERIALAPERPVLGVTDADCYADRLNFVFGIAALRSGAAVVSLARLRAGASIPTFTARAMKEIFHELGHAVGLASLRECRLRDALQQFSGGNGIEQLQPRIRGELRVGELEGKIPIDTSMQFGVSSPHSRWPFVRGRKFGWHLAFNHNERPFSMRSARLSARSLSDQG